MNQISSIEQFEQIIKDTPLVLAYFSGENCSVCNSLKPKIEMLIEQSFPSVKYIEIKTAQNPLLSARFNIFTVPVLLLLVEGKEYIRESRNISIVELSGKIDKIVQLYEQ
ncbi:MAG TPA: thioredoxin family protein [Prolixibacteraceae bacterium]|nr:thioredoxin family protein [Prolixibacteraceae bacterium]